MFSIDRKSFEPAYLQLKRQISDKIGYSELRPGQRLPSVRELEKLTGLSRVTVGKAVSELIKENLLISHGCKGTFVVERWPSAQEKTDVVGFIGQFKERSLFSDPYRLSILRGCEPTLRRYGKSFHFKEKIGRLNTVFDQNSVDGLMVFGPLFRVKEEVLELFRAKFPAVVLGQSFDHPYVSYVGSDNLNDSFSAVSRLIEDGHVRIGFLTPDVDGVTTRNRFDGYRRALEEHGVPFKEKLVFVGREGIERAAKSLIAAGTTAVFGTGTGISRSIAECLAGNGVKIPGDMEFLAYDDFEDALSPFADSYLVMEQPVEDIGRKAADVLCNMMEGKKRSVRVDLKSTLVRKRVEGNRVLREVAVLSIV